MRVILTAALLALTSPVFSQDLPTDSEPYGLELSASFPPCEVVFAGASCNGFDAVPEPDPQTPPAVPEGPNADKTKKPKKERRGAIVVAPLPISSPAIGSGIIPVLGYIFPLSKNDKESPPSTIGGAGLITNNGSRAFALGAVLYFDHNRYKTTTGYAHGNLDYNLYGPGVLNGPDTKLPLKQDGHAFFAEFLRRLWWQFFLGPRFFDGSSIITARTTDVDGIVLPPDLGLQQGLRSLGVRLQRDTVPNHYYQTKGTFTDFTVDFYSQALGSKYTYQSYKLTYSKYISVRKNQVLAMNAYFCGTGGQPPFYGYCIYGSQSQLRGYTAGHYFDQFMMTSQAEYRVALRWRLGLVAFGGIGGVIPPGNNPYLLEKSYFLPAGGGGLRFVLSKQYHVNLRADIAQGIDGHTFTMGVGEAF